MLNLLTLLLSQQPVLPQTAPAQATPTNPTNSTNAQETASAVPAPAPVAAPEYMTAPIAPPPLPNQAASPSFSLSRQVSLPQWSAPPAPQPAESPVATAPQPPVTQSPALSGGEPPTGPATTAAARNDAAGLATAPSSPDLALRTRHRQVELESRLAQIVAQSKSTDDLATQTRQRQTVIETRLAEIVAHDRLAKTAPRQETQITAAIDYANQGQFEQARQAVQAIAVPPAIRTNILRKITALETETTQPTLVRGATQARQIMALSKMPGPRLEQPVTTSSSAGPTWRSIAPRAERNFDLSVVNPGNPPNLAFNRLLNPNLLNNGDLAIVYPLPVPAPITSPFGWRIHPISGTRRFHSGTDIGAAQGTPVLAAYSGRVKGADYMGGYGLAITIEHKNGTLDTLYGHLSKVAVRPGEWVEQGSMIGAVGSTGAATGPHLHFEIRKLASDGWATLDPGPQLKQARDHLIKGTNQARIDRPNYQG